MRTSRKWSAEHKAAGYHEQDWGAPPTADAGVIGDYETPTGTMTVRHLEAGPTGAPELEIEWDTGTRVTVLNEAVATEYLVVEGARRVE